MKVYHANYCEDIRNFFLHSVTGNLIEIKNSLLETYTGAR